MAKARPVILEPIMRVTVQVPGEFQGTVMGTLNKRRGIIVDTDTPTGGAEVEDPSGMVTIVADVPLNDMFGYSTELRSCTQGKGEFSMEYRTHQPVFPAQQAELVAAHQQRFQTGKRKQ